MRYSTQNVLVALLVLILIGTGVRAAAPAPGSFAVSRIVADGNTLLAQSDLARVLEPHSGTTMTLAGIEKVTRELEALYHAKGHFLASVIVPQQTLRGGVLRLRILEGRLGEVRVEGNREYSRNFILEHLDPAVRGGTLDRVRLERGLLLLNGYPDLKAQSVLAPGRAIGTSDLIVKVTDHQPLDATISYDNFGQRLGGRNRVSTTVNGGNLFTEGDIFLANVTVAFPSDSDPFIAADYSVPLDEKGRRLGFSYASAATSVGQELRLLDLRGDATILGITHLWPLVLTPDRRTSLTAGLTSKSVSNFVFGAVPVSRDELRIASLSYSLIDQSHRRRSDAVGVVFAQGLGDVLGGMGSNDPLASRPGADNGFTKLNADASRTLMLDRQGQVNQLLFRFQGQLALEPLPVSEQFGVGGPFSVRGYTQAETLGDAGYAATAELRHTFYQNSQKKDAVQGVAFLDHGHASLDRPQAGERGSRTLTGAGVGARVVLSEFTNLRIDYGIPLSPSRNADGDGQRLYVQGSYTF